MGGPKQMVVVGAGPIGLHAAVRFVKRGVRVTVVESAPHVAAHVQRWSHVRLFSPWKYNVCDSTVALLEAAGLYDNAQECPTGGEYCSRYLDKLQTWLRAQPLATVLLNTKVESVARDGLLKKDDLGGRVRRQRRFVVKWSDVDGQEGFLYADCVLDTSGSYGNPNHLGPGGGAAVGEAALAADGRLSYYLPDVLGAQRSQYADRHTLVVGAGFSAITVIAALLKLRETAAATRVTWITRSTGTPYVVLENDVLPERAALAALGNRLVADHTPGVIHLPQVTVEALRTRGHAGVVEATVRVKGCDSTDTLAVDRVVACVGYRPDTALYSELHVHTCWATDGPIKLAASLLAAGGGGGDCLAQAAPGPDLLRTEEPGFHVLGMKSYGRSSAFILRVGLEQLTAVETLLNNEMR